MLFIGTEWVISSCERFNLPHSSHFQVSRVTTDHGSTQFIFHLYLRRSVFSRGSGEFRKVVCGQWTSGLLKCCNVRMIAMQCVQVINSFLSRPFTLRKQLFIGAEHTTEKGGANAQPSGCTLALFHTPISTEGAPPGYVSNDGHHFACKNPGRLQAAFHV